MAFPESFLQELAERNDIVDVVSGYVRLTKKSGSNLFGLCPFHSEKTPSFSVSPDKQIYHCFGCGKGGSVISFIMEIENLSFPEAVAFLANRAGMQLPEQSNDPGAKKRQRLLALNRDAARFFHAQLKTPAGQPARDYLARRQLTAQTVTRFGLGFAPDTWDSLVRAMKALGYSEQELFDGGPRPLRRRVRHVPQPAHVPGHRRARQRHRLLRAHSRRWRTQVHEQPGNHRFQQEPQFVRAQFG